jgi:hypothetical protein
MATRHDRPGMSGGDTSKSKEPAPAPVDLSEESVAGEEDPGASTEDVPEQAFNRPPPKLPPDGDAGA